MLTKLTLGMAKILQFRSGQITNTLGAAEEPDLIGEKKIKSIHQFAMGLRQILQTVIGPVLSAIGVAAIVYAVYLGVQYAKAESAEKRKDVQGRLIGAIIGAVILVVAATLCFAIDWAKVYFNMTGSKHKFDTGNDGDAFCNWCGGEEGDALHNLAAADKE